MPFSNLSRSKIRPKQRELEESKKEQVNCERAWEKKRKRKEPDSRPIALLKIMNFLSVLTSGITLEWINCLFYFILYGICVAAIKESEPVPLSINWNHMLSQYHGDVSFIWAYISWPTNGIEKKKNSWYSIQRTVSKWSSQSQTFVFLGAFLICSHLLCNMRIFLKASLKN